MEAIWNTCFKHDYLCKPAGVTMPNFKMICCFTRTEELLCGKCYYRSNMKPKLKKHVESIQNGICHPCNKCDYKAKDMGLLKKCVESIHEGVHYPCN